MTKQTEAMKQALEALKLITEVGERAATEIARGAIARITEADASSQWHGIRSYVRTFDGAVLECSETAHEINAAIAKHGSQS